MTALPPAAPTSSAPVGRLARWRLTEPVRLYVYGLALLAAVVVLVAAALNPNELLLMFALPTVVLFGFSVWAGVECARASVFSPVGFAEALNEAVSKGPRL